METVKLSAIEARILGSLIEKQRTVPDSYPMTLNGLLSACNQKSSRDPVMDLEEAAALSALDHLKSQHLVSEHSPASGRTLRYGQLFGKALRLPEQSVSLLATLMLRGPQTPGELRQNCERLYRFGDISSVDAFLEELAERRDGALVVQLPKDPGAREHRWSHLLCGEPILTPSSQRLGAGNQPAHSDWEALLAQVQALQNRVDRLERELGLEPNSETHDPS